MSVKAERSDWALRPSARSELHDPAVATIPAMWDRRPVARSITLCGQKILGKFGGDPRDKCRVIRYLLQSAKSCHCEFHVQPQSAAKAARKGQIRLTVIGTAISEQSGRFPSNSGIEDIFPNGRRCFRPLRTMP
ncbi:MAG TPA: hypothetical protein VHD36_16350 [Pirellulales bacterium]|nr:hypothetical protein [Pirellulales bacterium]